MKIFVKVENGQTQQMAIEDLKTVVIDSGISGDAHYLKFLDQILVGEYTTIKGITIFRHK